MGMIRNIVLKTAIKKALLDVTKEIESHGKDIPQSSSFGEMVMAYAMDHYVYYVDLIEKTWEATFFNIVSRHAQGEMPSSDLIQSEKEMGLHISLITQWVALRGGNLKNIYSLFSNDENPNINIEDDISEPANISGERTIITCTECSQKLRVPKNNNIKITCKKCGQVFSGKF